MHARDQSVVPHTRWGKRRQFSIGQSSEAHLFVRSGVLTLSIVFLRTQGFLNLMEIQSRTNTQREIRAELCEIFKAECSRILRTFVTKPGNGFVLLGSLLMHVGIAWFTACLYAFCCVTATREAASLSAQVTS